MDPIFFALPDAKALAQRLGHALQIPVGELSTRRFPDGESWMRVREDCREADAVVLADSSRPDDKLAQLLFAAETLRDVGARRVGLVAPYLAYMRQDERFHAGEALTSNYFAEFVAQHFQWLVTVDPHLHRHASLAELYRVPAFVAHSAPMVARWLATQPIDPVLVGPDTESEQWVAAVARLVDCPYVIFEKTRHGDRDVELSRVDLHPHRQRQPVILDDIISTGTTMVETLGRLHQAGLAAPVCVGIHGVFADAAERRIREAGARAVYTCNSIAHATNAVDVTAAIAEQTVVALRHCAAHAAE